MRLASFWVFGFIVFATLAQACGGSSEPEPTATPEVTATPEPTGPLGALAEYVSSTLESEFVEDCAQAEADADVGKICASFRGERDAQQAYVLGPTFSEFTQWAILEERAGEWLVVHTPELSSESLAVPGIPWPLATDTDVVVAGADPCLNVREGPGLDQPAIDCITDGATIQLSDGPIEADDFEWWQIADRGGWIVATYLRYPDAVEEPEPAPATATPAADDTGE